MRILFWNIRGIRKKRLAIKDHILEDDLDLVAIQETITQDFEDWELKEMVGNKEFIWCWSASRGHSGGFLIGST